MDTDLDIQWTQTRIDCIKKKVTHYRILDTGEEMPYDPSDAEDEDTEGSEGVVMEDWDSDAPSEHSVTLAGHENDTPSFVGVDMLYDSSDSGSSD